MRLENLHSRTISEASSWAAHFQGHKDWDDFLSTFFPGKTRRQVANIRPQEALRVLAQTPQSTPMKRAVIARLGQSGIRRLAGDVADKTSRARANLADAWRWLEQKLDAAITPPAPRSEWGFGLQPAQKPKKPNLRELRAKLDWRSSPFNDEVLGILGDSRHPNHKEWWILVHKKWGDDVAKQLGAIVQEQRSAGQPQPGQPSKQAGKKQQQRGAKTGSPGGWESEQTLDDDHARDPGWYQTRTGSRSAGRNPPNKDHARQAKINKRALASQEREKKGFSDVDEFGQMPSTASHILARIKNTFERVYKETDGMLELAQTGSLGRNHTMNYLTALKRAATKWLNYIDNRAIPYFDKAAEKNPSQWKGTRYHDFPDYPGAAVEDRAEIEGVSIVEAQRESSRMLNEVMALKERLAQPDKKPRYVPWPSGEHQDRTMKKLNRYQLRAEREQAKNRLRGRIEDNLDQDSDEQGSV